MRTLFRPVKVVAWVYPDPDMVVFRLDREVGVAPLRVRRSDAGRPGEALTMIACPAAGPLVRDVTFDRGRERFADLANAPVPDGSLLRRLASPTSAPPP